MRTLAVYFVTILVVVFNFLQLVNVQNNQYHESASQSYMKFSSQGIWVSPPRLFRQPYLLCLWLSFSALSISRFSLGNIFSFSHLFQTEKKIRKSHYLFNMGEDLDVPLRPKIPVHVRKPGVYQLAVVLTEDLVGDSEKCVR